MDRKFTINEVAKTDGSFRFKIEYTYTDSTGSKFTEKEFITVKNFEGRYGWFSSIERLDVKGTITKVNKDEKGELVSVFVEDKAGKRRRNLQRGHRYYWREHKDI